MKRRYANEVDGIYIQNRMNNRYLTGYACFIKLKNVSRPLIVNNGVEEICIKNENYEWIEVYPDNSNYALTIMFDDKQNLIEWYFDISKNIGVENGVPYEDDLYLDMIITPQGKKLILDEDELKEALNRCEIAKEDVTLAYKTLEELDKKYVQNLDELKTLTDFLYNELKLNREVDIDKTNKSK